MAAAGTSDRVTVNYHREGDGWWGEVPGWRWSCAGATLDECRELAREGVPFGVDERLRARSLMFMRVYGTAAVKVTPEASETLLLYVPDKAES